MQVKMQDRVMAAAGYKYERAAITSWLPSNQTLPRDWQSFMSQVHVLQHQPE